MIGVLWYDDDPKVGLEEKVRRAARCYRERHGRPATVAQVDAQELEGPATVEVDGAIVRVARGE